MIDPLIVQLKEPLQEVCHRFRVETLYVFGSGADGRFQPEQSDLDFLVTLQPQPPADYADNYLGLAQALEDLFRRRVDLVTESSIRNPYFRRAVFAARQLLYDGRHQETVA
ncbi:MAG: nucleotidyltransferase domain-containing protein [Verrucomicrobiota bacterium]|jgi:predicted nucleotidyltransferase